MKQSMPIIITIDGPVAAGKTVVGKMVATSLGCMFLDTGGMYRAVTRRALELNIDLKDVGELSALASSMSMQLETDEDGIDRLWVDGKDFTGELRSAEVERNVSIVAKVPGVRLAMVEKQRAISRDKHIVMVGRDIGTVVLKDAPIKIYLTASVQERARRRSLEMQSLGRELDSYQVREDLDRRDMIDSRREDSPLRPAEDAITINTDGIEIEDIVGRIVAIARRIQ